MALLRDELGWDEAELGTVFDALDCHGHVSREQVRAGAAPRPTCAPRRAAPRCARSAALDPRPRQATRPRVRPPAATQRFECGRTHSNPPAPPVPGHRRRRGAARPVRRRRAAAPPGARAPQLVDRLPARSELAVAAARARTSARAPARNGRAGAAGACPGIRAGSGASSEAACNGAAAQVAGPRRQAQQLLLPEAFLKPLLPPPHASLTPRRH